MDVERLEQTNVQLRREADRERVKISITANELKEFILNEPDPLIEGIPKRDNPFAKQSNGCCTIL